MESTCNCEISFRRWLMDSITMTSQGWNALSGDTMLGGIGLILLARIKAAFAFTLVFLMAVLLTLGSLLLTSLYLVTTLAMNLISTIPVPSNFTCLQTATQFLNSKLNFIYRIHRAVIATIFLFETAALTSTFLPGVLSTQSTVITAIDDWETTT